MKRLRRSHRPWLDSDSGVSLVMVLVFLMFTGLVVASVMRLSHVSLNAAFEAHDQAELVRDGDGALAAAINGMRNSTFNNDVGEQCDPFTMNGPNSSQKLAVTCKGAPGTPAISPISAANRPTDALLTLGQTEEAGIRQSGSGQLLIDGPVRSNSPIDVTPGGMNVINGGVTVRGACTGSDKITPTADCSPGNPVVADPAYDTDPASRPAMSTVYRSVPTCPAAANATLAFAPGYYDDAVGLSNLMKPYHADTNPQGCAPDAAGGRHTFWFQPGTYYFDFHNGESPAFPGDPVWSISDAGVRVVAGTPVGASPPSVNPTIPGSCLQSGDSTSNNGVQFMFGGRSQLNITAGLMELCGTYRANAPPIAIYGDANPADANPAPVPATPVGLTLTAATDTNPSCGAKFVPAGQSPLTRRVQYWEGETSGSARANLNNSQHGRACISLSGYAPAVDAPPGSVLTNATLIVSHSEDPEPAGGGGVTVAITPTRADGTAGSTVTKPVEASRPFTTQYIDITDAGANGIFDSVHSGGYSGASITYEVTRGSADVDAYLDTIQLNLTWAPPAMRSQSETITSYAGGSGTHAYHGSYRVNTGKVNKPKLTDQGFESNLPMAVAAAPSCVGVANYPAAGAGSCAMIKTTGSQSGLYVAGTGYAPLAAMDLALSGVAAPIFSVGLIVRKLAINASAASGYTGPMIMIPPDTPGGEPLKVYFQEYVCPLGQEAGCPDPGGAWQLAPPWVLSGSASAKFVDASGQPVTGSRAVEVLTWDLGLDLPH